MPNGHGFAHLGSLAFTPHAQCFGHFRHSRQIPGRTHEQFIGNTFRRKQHVQSMTHLLHTGERELIGSASHVEKFLLPQSPPDLISHFRSLTSRFRRIQLSGKMFELERRIINWRCWFFLSLTRERRCAMKILTWIFTPSQPSVVNPLELAAKAEKP